MIGILTYNVRHRKTYDVLCLLRVKGYQDVNVYAVPQHYKKKYKPLVEHRPGIDLDFPETEKICKEFLYNYYEGELNSFDIPEDEVLLVCGAGILPDCFIRSHKIINAHPGYIPNCRGLDAYKWAIYEGEPVGVTTHLIGQYIDAGEVIERKTIEIGKYDTFHGIAQKVYENEVNMLVGALDQLEDEHQMILPGEYIVHKRMSTECEQKLYEKFEIRKNADFVGL